MSEENIMPDCGKNDLNIIDFATACITPLSHLGLLKISGKEAKKLLQGQLTCDLEEISTQQTRLGAHCTPQGRILSLFRLFFYNENYYLHLPKSMIAHALKALKKYAIFFKVDLSDASEDLMGLGYCGNLLNKILPVIPAQTDAMTSLAEEVVIKLPGLVPRYLILANPTNLAKLEKKLNQHASLISVETWRYTDILAGIPAIYPETIEKFLPHEINLPGLNGVSFKKGCYTGQEIIARMQYRGKLKNHLYQTSIETNLLPQRGNDIYHETGIAGNIVDYCKKSDNHYALLVTANTEGKLFLDPEKTILLRGK